MGFHAERIRDERLDADAARPAEPEWRIMHINQTIEMAPEFSAISTETPRKTLGRQSEGTESPWVVTGAEVRDGPVDSVPAPVSIARLGRAYREARGCQYDPPKEKWIQSLTAVSDRQIDGAPKPAQVEEFPTEWTLYSERARDVERQMEQSECRSQE